MKGFGVFLLVIAFGIVVYIIIKLIPDWDNFLWWAKLLIIAVGLTIIGMFVFANAPQPKYYEPDYEFLCDDCQLNDPNICHQEKRPKARYCTDYKKKTS
jgi:cytochrome c biogenesis protein CcdA